MVGCVSNQAFENTDIENAHYYYRQGDYEASYKFAEDYFDDSSVEASQAISFVKSHPKVLNAGFNTFSYEYLNKSKGQGHEEVPIASFNKKRLERFKYVASEEMYQTAQNNFETVFPSFLENASRLEKEYADKQEQARLEVEKQYQQRQEEIEAEKNSLKVSKKIWNKLSEEEQNEVSSQRQIKVFDSDKYARIIAVQVVNESTYNNGVMANMGSLVAQASYIDSRTLGNYSATAQLGTAVVGALVGGMLDKQTEIKYHFRYTLELNNGDSFTKDIYQNNRFHKTSGMCVELEGFSDVNSAYCEKLSLNRLKSEYLPKTMNKDKTCSVDQILAMKNAGLNDIQIKAACN